MWKLLLAVTLALTSASVGAQTAAPANPPLWIVRDADTTIYLLGIVGALDDRPWFEGQVRAAFDSSTELVLPITPNENPTKADLDLARSFYATQAPPISRGLSDRQNQAMRDALRTLNITTLSVDGVDAWVVANSLSEARLREAGYSNAPIAVLSQAARERGMAVSGLESNESSFRTIDALPQDQQMAWLRELLDDPARQMRLMSEAIAAWSSGDAERAAMVANEMIASRPAVANQNAERSERLAQFIERRLANPGTVFVVHVTSQYIGDQGALRNLERRGIRVNRLLPETPLPPLQFAAQRQGTAAAPPPGAIQSTSTQVGESGVAAGVGPRVALVVGIGTYGALGNLTNPVNDARALAAALRAMGFDVDLILDPNQRTLKNAISRLGERMGRAGRGATGLFFFAGHGIQSRGVNYLVPTGAVINREADLDLEAVPADTVLVQMQEAQVSTNIIILDACRNMPLTRSFRNAGRGLAQMDAPNGSFIAYSTAPGSVAADGSGANSPFATALLREIAQPGQPIEAVFRNVRRAVLRDTEGLQTPWDSSSLTEPFYFRAR